MLKLNRGIGQAIVIGDGPDQITIVVVNIRGDKTRIGIKARRDIPVDREEVRKAIEAKQGSQA